MIHCSFSSIYICKHGKEERKKRKILQAAKKLLTSIKEKGPLGKKSPLTRKLESSQ